MLRNTPNAAEKQQMPTMRTSTWHVGTLLSSSIHTPLSVDSVPWIIQGTNPGVRHCVALSFHTDHTPSSIPSSWIIQGTNKKACGLLHGTLFSPSTPLCWSLVFPTFHFMYYDNTVTINIEQGSMHWQTIMTTWPLASLSLFNHELDFVSLIFGLDFASSKGFRLRVNPRS